MLTLAGETNAAARAKAILDFETRIAKVHWTRVESRDATKTYNMMTLRRSDEARRPGFDFATMLEGLGIKASEVIVAQPSAITGIASWSRKRRSACSRTSCWSARSTAIRPILPSAFDKESFAFYGTALSGTPEQEARWKRAVDFTVGALTDDVSKLYVERYFPPETKAAADELVKNVVAAMGRRIDALDLDEARDQGPGAGQARRLSSPRSAIPASGTIIRRSKSVRATRSETPCARPNGITSMRSASSADRSAGGNGA